MLRYRPPNPLHPLLGGSRSFQSRSFHDLLKHAPLYVEIHPLNPLRPLLGGSRSFQSRSLRDLLKHAPLYVETPLLNPDWRRAARFRMSAGHLKITLFFQRFHSGLFHEIPRAEIIGKTNENAAAEIVPVSVFHIFGGCNVRE